MTPDAEQAAGPRARLAGFGNAWFFRHEIEAVRAFATTASEDECRAELERLSKVRDGRLEQWRQSQ